MCPTASIPFFFIQKGAKRLCDIGHFRKVFDLRAVEPGHDLPAPESWLAELFGELGVPELGKFGCDHDLAGYAAIEDDVGCDFRRLCTIAKGDDRCVFEFYRKGTAPDNAHLNK